MKLTKSLQSLRHFWLMGAFLFLLFPAVASAASTVGNPAIIAQLEIVKATLADLKTQLQTVENRLISEIGLVEERLNDKLDAQQDDLNAKLDAQGIDLTFLVKDAESQEKDITISSTLCFGHAFSNELQVGFGAEFGAEWPMLLSVNAKGMVEVKLAGTELNMGSEICIEVPLYKLASNPLPEFLDDTEDFDKLIAGITGPAQAIIPAVATLYTKVMPSQEQVMRATANVVVAATGFDIIDGVPSTEFVPADLLLPEKLFAPIINDPDRQQLYHAFADFIPTAAALVTDPCQALEDSPLQIDTNSLGLLCVIGSDFSHLMVNLTDPLHFFHPLNFGALVP